MRKQTYIKTTKKLRKTVETIDNHINNHGKTHKNSPQKEYQLWISFGTLETNKKIQPKKA